MTKAPAWSYSSLTKFETCARQYYLTRVAKLVVEKQTEATLWGNRVHQALEDRVKSKKPLPDGMEQWEPLAAKFDEPKGRVFTETRFTLNKNLSPSKWTSPDAWCRGIIDIGVDAGEKVALLDWKTGKIKHDIDQLKLFSAMYMQTYPYVREVSTGFVWLAFNKVTKENYKREDLPAIWQELMPRVQRLEIAYDKDKWPPKPSGLCAGWCPVGRDHCEFWSPKKEKA